MQSQKQNGIDLVPSNKREIITHCGVITKVDKESDHRIIRIKIIINNNNKKLARMKSIYEEVEANKYTRTKAFSFDNDTSGKLKQFCQVITKEANERPGRKKYPSKIEAKNKHMELRKLDDSRKKMRNRG